MASAKLSRAYMAKAAWPEFRVDAEKCSKCKRCVETCPTNGIYWGDDDLPHLGGYGAFEVACISCRNCAASCPTDAITVIGGYRVEKGRYQTFLDGERLLMPNPFNEINPRPFRDLAVELTETEKVIYQRRSNRLFKDKPVPKELLHRILEAGRFAPSGGNCQPWRFMVITDKELLKEISDKCLGILRRMAKMYLKGKPGKGTVGGRMFFTMYSYFDPNSVDQRIIGGMECVARKDDIWMNAPAVIMVLGDTRGIGNPSLDCGICAQNIVLAAHSLGLGTCYVGFSTAMDRIPGYVKKLGIKWPYKLITSIAVGYPKGKTDKAVERDLPQVTWIE